MQSPRGVRKSSVVTSIVDLFVAFTFEWPRKVTASRKLRFNCTNSTACSLKEQNLPRLLLSLCKRAPYRSQYYPVFLELRLQNRWQNRTGSSNSYSIICLSWNVGRQTH